LGFNSIDELSAEFMPNPPCQPALASAACRQYDGELTRNVDIFGDNLHPALRYVRDRAIPRQRSGTELDLCEASAHATLALTSIREHVDPSPFRWWFFQLWNWFTGELLEFA
jgi:hypothetical protein